MFFFAYQVIPGGFEADTKIPDWEEIGDKQRTMAI